MFSLSVVFLMIGKPYDLSVDANDIKVANLQAYDVLNYELDSNLTHGKYRAEVVTRYRKYDELTKVSGEYIDDKGSLHTLSGDKGTIKGNVMRVDGNGHYRNVFENVDYKSKTIIYDKKALRSPTPFVLTQNADKVTGASANYNIDTKQLKAKKVKAWLQTKD